MKIFKKSFFTIVAAFITCLSCLAQVNIIVPQYYEARGYSEGLAAVKGKEGWGFVDVKGNVIIPFIYKKVRDFHEGRAAVKTEKGWGYIDKNNKLIISDKYFDAKDFNDGMAAVKVKSDTDEHYSDGYDEEKIARQGEMLSWIYINSEGEMAFDDFYSNVSTFHDGVACVFKDKSWEYINSKGESVSKVRLENLYPLHYSNGLIPNMGGELGDEWGYSDLSGKWIIQPQYRSVSEFCDGIAVVEEFGGNMKVIDNKGIVLFDGVNDLIAIQRGGFFIDGKNLYNRDNVSKPYAILNSECNFYNDVVFASSIDIGGVSVTGSYKSPLNIQSVEILRSITPISYKQPCNGLWATEFDNGYWGFTAFNMKDFIGQYVDSQMKDWLKRGEFESTSTYSNRTSEANCQQKMVYYADDLINNWLKKGLEQWSLSEYNADKESFELTTDFGKYTIKIPTARARILKGNWSSTKKQIGFKYDNGLTLEKIDFIISQGNKDLTLSVNTTTGTIIQEDHDVIDKELPTIKWLEFMATTTSKECPIRLGVNSKSKIESVTITVNGIQNRGIKTVNSSDYDLTINRTLTLNEGENVIKVSVRNSAGTAQEEKTIVYRPQGGELPSIEWLDFAATANKKEYQMRLGIKSKSKIEEVNVTLNGNQSRGINPHCRLIQCN